jgi:hypothetical protein
VISYVQEFFLFTTVAALAVLSFVAGLQADAARRLARGGMMAGAIGTHWHNGDPFEDSLDAFHLLVLLVCILLLSFRDARDRPVGGCRLDLDAG